MQVDNGFNEICRTQVRKHCQTLLQLDYALNRCKVRMGALQGQKPMRRKNVRKELQYKLFSLDSSWVYFVRLHSPTNTSRTVTKKTYTSIFIYFDTPNNMHPHFNLFILWHTQPIRIYPLSVYTLALPVHWDCCSSSLRLVGWLNSIYDYDDCQQDDVGNDHYSAQDDDVGDDQRCWGMQVGGQKQTPATPLWQFWQARLSAVCSQCWPAALSVWASWILPPPIWALGLSQKRWESSVICVRTLFYLPASWTITWVNNTKSHVS